MSAAEFMPLNPLVLAELEAYRADHELLEAAGRRRVSLDGPLLLRLDGRAFHTLTKGMQRPFDAGFEAAMDAVCEALLDAQLGVRCAYVQSDEISAVIEPAGCPFDARHEKLVSVSASLAAAAFSLQVGRVAMFDARAIPTVSVAQALGVLAERQLDASKNAVSQLAHWTLVLQEGLTGRQAERRLRPLNLAARGDLCEQLGHPVSEMPAERVRGRLCQFAQVPHLGVNPLTGETVPTVRRRMVWARPAPDFRRLHSLPGN